MSQVEVDRQSAVSGWCDRDRRRAVLPADRACIEASLPLRALIVDLIGAAEATGNGGDEARRTQNADDLYDACALLGRLIADQGGSPTMACFTIEHACAEMRVDSAFWVGPARAALAEGFAAALVENARREGLRAWEYAGCTVALGEGAIAIAAGHPSDDDEVIAQWAARIAKTAALKGVRRAVVAGSERTRGAMIEALAFVGIETPPSQAGSRT